MRPSRQVLSLPWPNLVMTALAPLLLSVDGAQAIATLESDAQGTESMASMLIPIDPIVSSESPQTMIEWIEEPPALSEEFIGEDNGLIAEKPVAIAEPHDDAGQQRGYIEIERVEIADQPADNEQVVTITGSLPTPCHQLGWEIPPAPSEDGVLRIQAWSISAPNQICAQVIQPFSAQITVATPVEKVSVNDVMPSHHSGTISVPRPYWPIAISEPEFSIIDNTPTAIAVEDRSVPSPLIRSYTRGGGSGGTITTTPGPLPVAAALAGWHSARRLRRRCKQP